MKTPRFVRYTLGLGLFVGGMAFAAPKQPHISVRLPRASYNVTFSGKDIVAPHFQLIHTESGLRGNAYGAPTSLEFKDGKVTGNIGTSNVNLKTTTQGDTVKAEGGFLGRPVTVRYAPHEVEVYINDCTYRLKGTEEAGSFAGKRSCDGALMPPSELTLPAEFQQLSAPAQVTLLLLSLG